MVEKDICFFFKPETSTNSKLALKIGPNCRKRKCLFSQPPILIGYVSFREFIPQMVKNGDFHPMGSESVKNHQLNKHKLPHPCLPRKLWRWPTFSPCQMDRVHSKRVDANESQMDEQNLCISLSHIICVFVNFIEL